MKDLVKEHYQNGDEWHDPLSRISNNLYNHYQRLLELHAPLKGKYLLDLGCGSGDETEFFLNADVQRYVGVDFSENMLAKLNQDHDDPRVKTYCLDLREIEISGIKEEERSVHHAHHGNFLSEKERDFASRAYQRINLSWAIKYLNNKELSDLCQKLHSLLNDNGTLVFTEPHPIRGMSLVEPFNYQAREFRFYDGVGKDKFPIFHRTIADHLNIFSEAGFKFVKMLELESHPNDPWVKPSRFPKGTKYPARLMIKWKKENK